jgi:uncharacterized protein (DUF4415 family)
MREQYDFSKMKSVKNPYVKMLKQPITIRLDRDGVSYFKALSETQDGYHYRNHTLR